MQIVKTATGNQIKMSKSEWESIGKTAGWGIGDGMETVDIGSTPAGEPCAQVGSDNYRKLTRMEITAFAKQCMRMFPDKPAGARYVTTNNPHDAGTYHELGIKFDMDDEEAEEYAYDVQNNMPENWDDEARAELQAQGYFELLAGGDVEEEAPVNPEGNDISGVY